MDVALTAFYIPGKAFDDKPFHSRNPNTGSFIKSVIIYITSNVALSQCTEQEMLRTLETKRKISSK
jgi:hypothetical protein